MNKYQTTWKYEHLCVFISVFLLNQASHCMGTLPKCTAIHRSSKGSTRGGLCATPQGLTHRWSHDPGSIDITSTAQGGGGNFKDRTLFWRGFCCCDARMGERIHWWTERWLELCFLEWLQWLQWSPHPQLLDVVWCSAAVLVVVV